MKNINIDLLHRDLWIVSILNVFITVISIQFKSIAVLVSGLFVSFIYWSTKAFVKNGITFPGNIPNSITLLRFILLLICALIHLRFTQFQLGIAFAIICIADIFDGYFARKLNQSSILGEYLDKETDAIFVLILCVLIYLNIHHSYWVLIPGLIRYLYFAGIYYFMNGNEKEHKDPWAKVIAVFIFVTLIFQFILPQTISKPLLSLAVISIIYSFSRSILYQFNLFSIK